MRPIRSSSEVALDPLKGPRDEAKVKEMLKKACYAGEKIVMIVDTDYPQFKAIGDVAAMRSASPG